MMFKKKNNGIYLDYAATTPISDRAAKAMQPYFSEHFGNPSSLHLMGQKAQSAIDKARHDVSEILGGNWKEVYFTPSATIAINMALRGTVKRFSGKDPHIITTNIEHSAVLNTCRDLEKSGAEVTYLPANKDGLITAEQVAKALKQNTVLVSVMYVNNEIGTIQPIADIAKVIRKFKESNKNTTYPVFHSDAVQAANYLALNAEELGADMMNISGHKIYGPKGVGVLYKKESTDIAPIITGGEQERGLLAGTENVPAIRGFTEALQETEEQKEKEARRVKELRDTLIEKVLNSAPSVRLNGSREKRVPNNASFCFEGRSNEMLIPAFDAEGIYVSGGSACTARVPEPSHVIEAIGREECAKNTIRFSLGRGTTKKDVETAANVTIQLAKV